MRYCHIPFDETTRLMGGKLHASSPRHGALWTRLHGLGLLMDEPIFARYDPAPRAILFYQATNPEETEAYPLAVGLGVAHLCWTEETA